MAPEETIITSILYFSDFNRFKETVSNSYKQIFVGRMDYNKNIFYSTQHLLYAKTSFEIFKKNPLLGIGPNNFRRECGSIKYEFTPGDLLEFQYLNPDDFPENNCSTHPHNIFFQLLSETGLLGIIFYIIFNIYLFLQTINFFFKKNYNQVQYFFLLPLIYYINPLFPSGNFFNNWYMCFGILGLPFYIYLDRIKKSIIKKLIIEVYFTPSKATSSLYFGKLFILITIDLEIPKFNKNETDNIR